MKRIEQLYAYVVVDPADDTEGLVAYLVGDTMMPMVAANTLRVESMRRIAEQIAQCENVSIRLCRFEIRTDLEVIDP